jgi:hypothetical protein
MGRPAPKKAEDDVSAAGQPAAGRREPLSIPVPVSFLMQRRPGGPRIFGFVAGDGMAVYREHGLVDDQGKPVAS